MNAASTALFWLTALLWCGLASPLHADKLYVVQRYDTLTRIARDHGLTSAKLADYNGLPRDVKVRVGQRLRIPTDDDEAAPASPPALSESVTRAIRNASVARGRWQHIVVHHSGTREGSPAGMDQYHRKVRHMENGLAYHFVIGNGNGMKDGEVAIGRRWREQLDGGHLASEQLNKIALGICLVGNFDKDEPTPKQLRSLKALISTLLERCNLPRSAVKTHQPINPIYTRCPGSHFPSAQVGKELQPWKSEKKR